MKNKNKIDSTKFNNDLSFGQRGEDIIMEFLSRNKDIKMICPSNCVSSDEKIWKRFDLYAQTHKGKVIKFEVKTDKYVSNNYDTGNILIEKTFNKKASGISNTTADYWINYFINFDTENIWMIKVSDLKELIKKNNFPCSYVGDNNLVYGYLIPRKEMKQYFKVFTLNQIKNDSKYKGDIFGYNGEHKNDVLRDIKMVNVRPTHTKGNNDNFIYMKNPLDE